MHRPEGSHDRDAGFTVHGRRVGPGEPPFVVAEMSGNHQGDLGRALAIVDAVARSGADALKLQTYRADTITLDVDGDAFRIGDSHELWGGRRLFDLYDEAHTPWDWHEPLFRRAREHGLVPFSSPFDPTAIELLESLDCELYKVASAEIVDLPLIAAMARTGKPIVISTGMATLSEVDRAVSTAREGGASGIAVLSCTSSYPARAEDQHLLSIPALAAAFGVTTGFSDHTEGIGVSVAAVALGASVIEKHVTLSREGGGIDAAFSLEPTELAQLVRECRAAHEAVRPACFGPRAAEADLLRLRRSLYVVEDVCEGDLVTHTNVRSIRPTGGLPADEIDKVLGRTFTQDVPRGTALTWDLI